MILTNQIAALAQKNVMMRFGFHHSPLYDTHMEEEWANKYVGLPQGKS